jgi:hypothetical protein
MIFDKQLCFIDEGMITAATSGVVGSAIDLGAPNQLGKGRPAYIAVACKSDATATGNPVIKFHLEFADDAVFTTPVRVPLSLPPLAKTDLAAGSVITALAPMYSKRYVRFYLETTIALTCSTLTIGIVLDPQTNK